MNEDWYGKEPDTFFNRKVQPVLAFAFASIMPSTLLYALILWVMGLFHKGPWR